MRQDMKEIIIDRPRKSGRPDTYHTVTKDPEVTWEKMQAPYQIRKSLNDRLAPLRRFLQSRVGHQWDKVYSEICEKADSRSLTGNHLREHVSWMVSFDCKREKNGDVFDVKGYRPRAGEFYVEGDGILRQYNPKPFRFKRPTPPSIPIADLSEYQKINGLWFRVDFVVSNVKPETGMKLFDGKCYKEVSLGYDRTARKALTKILVPTRKQQLSGEEVTRLKLEEQLKQLAA